MAANPRRSLAYPGCVRARLRETRIKTRAARCEFFRRIVKGPSIASEYPIGINFVSFASHAVIAIPSMSGLISIGGISALGMNLNVDIFLPPVLF